MAPAARTCCEPEGFVACFERRSWAGDLIGVDEDAVGFEGGVGLFEDGALVRVVEMVDGERRDDGAEIFRKRLGDVVELIPGDIAIAAQARLGKIEHGRGEVDDVEMRGGEAVAEQARHEAGASTELTDGLSTRRDEIERPAVEAVAAGE